MRYFHKILFHFIWGSEKRHHNTKFDNWRANVVKSVILNDLTTSKLFRVRNTELINNHWIGKPMRSEYHSLIHFYRLSKTYKYTESFIEEYAKLIDIGCASGLFLTFLPNKEKLGLDLICNCKDYGVKNGIKIVNGNAESLPFLDNEFNISFLLEVIEHVPNPFKVLKEAKRVCSEKIICTFPVFEKTKIKPFDSSQYFQNDSHYLELNKTDFINMITHIKIKDFRYELLDIFDEITLGQKVLSLLAGFHWPKWHLFIINL